MNIGCKVFAYPYGKPKHIPPGIERVLDENGVSHALTTVRGCYRDGDDPFLIKRVPVFYEDDLATFANKCYGITPEEGLRLKAAVVKFPKLFRSFGDDLTGLARSVNR